MFSEDEKGVSVVLGAILLLGIAVAVFPIWYNYYVENTMESKETDHMKSVREKYLELQSKVGFMDGPGEGGKVKIPMNAGSVRFFVGQSPLGTLATNPGSDIRVDNTGVQEIITVDPGSIKFDGQNLYYPDQTFIFEGGHVFLAQDEVELMLSSDEDLISWENSLKVSYIKISGKEYSITSNSTESLNISWGGRERFPKNKEWENTENIRINFETQYDNVWMSYLIEKAENIENGSAAFYENGASLQIWNENLKYQVSSTETGEDVKVITPTVATLDNGEVWSDAAILRMSYDFKDYSEGAVRFKWRVKDGTWSATGWSSQYGADDNYSELITGIRRNTTYEYKAQIKYDSKDKEGEIKTFNTGNRDSYGGGGGGSINPEKSARLVGTYGINRDTMGLTFRNTGDNTIHFGDSVVAFYNEESQKEFQDWSSPTLGIPSSPIGGEWKSPTNNVSIPVDEEENIILSFSGPQNPKFNSGEYFVYKAEYSNGTQSIYFVNVIP